MGTSRPGPHREPEAPENASAQPSRAGGFRPPPGYGVRELGESGVLRYRAVRPAVPDAAGRAELRVLTRRVLHHTAVAIDQLRREQDDVERMRAETRAILGRLQAA